MRNFSFEWIVLLLVFVVIPLANYVLGRMRRRFDPPSSRRQPMPDMGFRRQAAPTPTPVSPAPREQAQAAASTGTMTPSRRHWSRKTLFRTRRDVRRVIVATTVLGPCRAYDPPG